MFTVFYFGSLICYGWIVWAFDEADKDGDKSKLGIATAGAIALCDIFLGLLYHSKILNRLSFMTLLAIIARVLIFGGGEGKWLYGYMLYYVLFASIVSWTIARIHFPYATALSEDKMLDASSHKKKQVDVTRYPEFILVFCTVSYVVTIAMVQAFQPKGVSPAPLVVFSRTLTYVNVCIVSIFTVTTIFFIINIRRVFYRKKHHLKRKVNYFIAHTRFGIFEIYSLCLYICILGWSFIFYWISNSTLFVICGVVVPLIVYYFIQGYLAFIHNDCMYFQDIKVINARQNKHNQELMKIREASKEIQNEVATGTYAGVAPDDLGLCKKVYRVE